MTRRSAHHIQVVAATAERAGSWRMAADESCIELVVDGAVVCEVAPYRHDATGEHFAWWAMAGERMLSCKEGLSDACQEAAAELAISAPLPRDLFVQIVHAGEIDAPIVIPAPVAGGRGPGDGLLERFADCLARILDEPLMVLPGRDPGGSPEPPELRLAHFRPDPSEIAAVLLEEAGR